MSALDDWYALPDVRGNGDKPTVVVHWPQEVFAHVEHDPSQIVRLNLGGVTFRRPRSDLILMLRAAIEAVEVAQ